MAGYYLRYIPCIPKFSCLSLWLEDPGAPLRIPPKLPGPRGGGLVFEDFEGFQGLGFRVLRVLRVLRVFGNKTPNTGRTEKGGWV